METILGTSVLQGPPKGWMEAPAAGPSSVLLRRPGGWPHGSLVIGGELDRIAAPNKCPLAMVMVRWTMFKIVPLIPLLNLASIFASLWYPMLSTQPSSKAFSQLLSSLIFLMFGAQLLYLPLCRLLASVPETPLLSSLFLQHHPALFTYSSHLHVSLFPYTLPVTFLPRALL